MAALAVAIVSAVIAAGALWYARRSAAASAESATAAATTAALDVQRRHAELTPRFRVTCERPGTATVADWAEWAKDSSNGILHLRVFLAGPPELGRLDALTVTIRDDNPWRSQWEQQPDGPTPEQVAEQIWGPYCFVTGTAHVAARQIWVGDPHLMGRDMPTSGMPVGEELAFLLEPTRPPEWLGHTRWDWREEQRTVIRLEMECRREGWDSWTLACEIDTADLPSTVDVP